MQKYFSNMTDGERRVVRNWRLFSVGFYGSIFAGLIAYTALSQKPDVNYASANVVQETARAAEARH
jgi:hypothetical protein